MRYTKGKWVASYKDTFSVEQTLNKIVLAHITKLYECLKKSECHGVPMYYMDIQARIEGVDWNEVDVDKADEIRMKDLEELIWTFSDNEPDISDYDFHYDFGNDVPCGIQCSNEAESNRYADDMKVWDERKKKGYKLFGDTYYDLSW